MILKIQYHDIHSISVYDALSSDIEIIESGFVIVPRFATTESFEVIPETLDTSQKSENDVESGWIQGDGDNM